MAPSPPISPTQHYIGESEGNSNSGAHPATPAATPAVVPGLGGTADDASNADIERKKNRLSTDSKTLSELLVADSDRKIADLRANMKKTSNELKAEMVALLDSAPRVQAP